MTKEQLRQDALQSRRALPRSSVAEMSRRVAENVFSLGEYQSARRIASYVARADEVQTSLILERALIEGKSVAVPLVDPSSDEMLFLEIRSLGDLSPGKFGILEPKRTGQPVSLDETDMVLVPLIAWDKRGHRIGYGRGYFDRALSGRGGSIAVGLAFDSQTVPHVPEGPSDVQLDLVVTEKNTFRFGSRPS